MILSCSCSHAGQDSIHGKGKRVFNEMKSANARCTVCGKTASIAKEKTVKK